MAEETPVSLELVQEADTGKLLVTILERLTRVEHSVIELRREDQHLDRAILELRDTVSAIRDDVAAINKEAPNDNSK